MNQFKLIFFIILLIGITIKTEAQIISIDKFDTADYNIKSKWNYLISFGLEVDKQQQILYDATNLAEISLQKNKNLFLFSSSYRFTYNGPQDILDAGYFHLRFRHNYKNKFQPESFIQLQWDNKRGLERRFLLGENFRYNIWHQNNWDFNAGIGIMLENETWNFDGIDTTIKLPLEKSFIENKFIKFNSYIRLDCKTSINSDLGIKVFLQTLFSNFKPRIAPNIQWNVNAGKHLGFGINFNALYDVSPTIPIPNFYYSFSNSLYYKL